jgi:hypothetical protein
MAVAAPGAPQEHKARSSVAQLLLKILAQLTHEELCRDVRIAPDRDADPVDRVPAQRLQPGVEGTEAAFAQK